MAMTVIRRALLSIAIALAVGVSGTNASAIETDGSATVLRGSETNASATERDGSPSVLRGSRPEPQAPLPVPVPAGPPVCPAGSVDEPGYGCVLTGYAGEPDVYEPYFGLDAGFVDIQRHKLRRLGIHSIFRATHRAVGMTNHR